MTPIKIADSAQVEYPGSAPFSHDNSWLLLQHPGGFFGLYSRNGDTYDFVRLLPAIVNHHSEPRWSRRDNDLFYFISGNTLNWYLLKTDTFNPQHIFDEYVSVSSRGEADIDRTGDLLVFAGMRHDGIAEVFTYRISTNSKGAVFPQAEPFDGLKIASDQIILSRTDGIHVVGLPDWYDLTSANGHAAVAQYEGRDVLLWCNSAEKDMPADTLRNAVERVDIGTAFEYGLKSFDWKYAFHISTCDLEWCLVSTYAPDNSLPMQLLKIPLDGAPAEVICNTGGTYRDYASQPKASLSRDGSLAVYNVDDGASVSTWLVHLTEPRPVATEPKPVLSTLTEIDFSRPEYAHRKWRLEQEMEVIDGQLVITRSKMFDRA